MSTLQEQRMVAAHKMGRRDYQDGRSMYATFYPEGSDEWMAYQAGYQGERKRHIDDMVSDFNYVGSKYHY